MSDQIVSENIPSVNTPTFPVPPLPDPDVDEWCVFLHLERFGWNKVEIAGRVIAKSAHGGSVLIVYLSPITLRTTWKWLDRTSIVHVLKPMADAEFLQAPA